MKKCGIRAAGGMIGHAACDLEWGHDGMVHYNGGDGFHSRQNEEKHRQRQEHRKSVETWLDLDSASNTEGSNG